MTTRIESVFFDVGETLVDETREYGTWADWLGVPRHTFSSVFGAIISQGGDYRETFQHFQPGFDLATEREARAAAGKPETFNEDDLYSDARDCLAALQDLGLLVGVAGNQTARSESILRSLELPIDVLGTSDGWGVEKPSPQFFDRLLLEAKAEAQSVLYVGDRIDNDVRAAQDRGLPTVLIRRGPWGHILRNPELEAKCLFVIDTLDDLPKLIADHNAQATDS